jgi:hypothetical protein
MAYALRTKWPGISAQHADHCRARDGEECTCGPLGYRASLEDPESGEPVLSPVLDSPAEAREWRHEQQQAFDAWRATEEERPTVDSTVEELLAAAARGSARDRYGRRFAPEELTQLRWALTGYVHEEIGSMAIAEVRARHLQALIDRLDASGLSQRRVDGVVQALRTLFAYAGERGLVESSPAEALALPDEEPAPASAPAPDTAAAPVLSPQQQAALSTPLLPAQFSVITEQVIWTLLKVVAIIFVLIALVLVAESV